MKDNYITIGFLKFLNSQGYIDTRDIDGRICAIYPFLFTWGVCYDLDEEGYRGRYCFDSLCSAQGFLKNWNGVKLPEVGQEGCTAIK